MSHFRGAMLAAPPLLSGCSTSQFGTGILIGLAIGLVVGVLAVTAALGLVQAVRSDFRGSIPEPNDRRAA